MEEREILLGLFKLYSGKETDIRNNPIDFNEDNGLKFHMWRIEFMYCESYKNLCERWGISYKSKEGIEKGFDRYVRNFIKKYIGYPIDEEEEKRIYKLYKSY